MSAASGRFMAAFGWEMRLQWRYYFWLVAVIVTLVWSTLLASLTPGARTLWIPVIVFGDISNIGLLFIAGSLILERQQGTLDAVAVMPIATGTWLLAKLLSLTLLSTTCGVVLTLLNLESINWLRVIPAIAVTAAFFTSAGFILVCPFRNILNYFLVMALATTVLSLPLLSYFDIAESAMLWLLPSYPLVLLLELAFGDGTRPQFLLALFISLAWIAVSHWLGIQCFHRFVAARAGV